MSASIYDVAKLANVSIATVSRVLNNSANVREEKAEAVLEAVKKLKFEPNGMARGLAKNVTGLIGLYIPVQSIDRFWSIDYYSEIFKGILAGLQNTQYSIVLITEETYPEAKIKKPKYMQYIGQNRIDGLLLNGYDRGQYFEQFKELLDSGFPVAYIGKRVDNNCLNVYAEYSWYTQQILTYFYAAGHRKILQPAFDTDEFQETRFKDCVNTFNADKYQPIEVYPLTINPTDNIRNIEKALLQYLRDGITGIYFGELSIAERILNILVSNNISVPEDVSIIGVEHVKDRGKQFSQPLNCFYVPGFEMGKTLAEMLVQQLSSDKGKANQEKEKLIFPSYYDRGSLTHRTK